VESWLQKPDPAQAGSTVLIRGRPVPTTNTRGYPGVSKRTKARGFIARIGVSGVRKYLGTFATFDEAVAARKAAARKRDAKKAIAARKDAERELQRAQKRERNLVEARP
jgi:hypothetical protein